MAKYPFDEIGLTVPQAGREIGLSAPASYAAAHRGEIPVLRFGRRMIVPLKAWRQLLETGKRPEASDGKAA